jgi:hypothetical protein
MKHRQAMASVPWQVFPTFTAGLAGFTACLGYLASHNAAEGICSTVAWHGRARMKSLGDGSCNNKVI